MKPLAKKIVELLVPSRYQLAFRYAWLNMKGRLDEEMLVAATLLNRRRRFIDIGANVGIYSYYFGKKFESVESFEPISEITYRISALGASNINIHNVALSNELGSLDFYIPIKEGKLAAPLASLEERDAPFEKRTVSVRTLDSYQYSDVDLIKIDVEGHEFSTIEGAIETILRCKPLLIVEIEQRHTSKPLEEIFNSIVQHGYDGFFLANDSLIPLSKFSYGVHQEPYLDDVNSELYINNFIFKAAN